MILPKKEFPRLRISLQDDSSRKGWMKSAAGQIQWVMGLFLTLFLMIVLFAQLQIVAFQESSLYMEDALAAANLASAVIDLQEYGISNTIMIADPEKAYEKYCTALKGNLQLNEQWEGNNSSLLSGKVIVENYTIYNVQGNTVTVYYRGNDGLLYVSQEELGACRAPNGVPVVSTGIYSEISFPVNGLFGVQVRAHKGKLVDIVEN